jgi:hypothetical protein
MAAKDLADLRVCQECERTMCAHHSWLTGNRRGAETYWHDRSGLCRACKQRNVRMAKRASAPKAPRVAPNRGLLSEDSNMWLDDYDMIRDSVDSIREAAERLGIGYARLDKMLYRARRRGDARGRPPLEQLERAIDLGAPFGRTHEHSFLGRAA